VGIRCQGEGEAKIGPGGAFGYTEETTTTDGKEGGSDNLLKYIRKPLENPLRVRSCGEPAISPCVLSAGDENGLFVPCAVTSL